MTPPGPWARIAACLNPAGAAVARWQVPGRLEVFGQHTDYGGGRALIAALPRGFAFGGCLRPRHRGAPAIVRITDANDRAQTVACAGRPGTTLSGWRHLVDVVVQRLSRNFPGAVPSADIAFASTLPRASGMSSSSALLTGVAMGLVHLGEIDRHPAWRDAIGSDEDIASYFACVENGQPFRDLTGDPGVGTQGGSEDHTAMICGEAEYLRLYSFLPVRLDGRVALPASWTFVVAASGVAADKTGAAREQYNRAAEALGVLRKMSPGSDLAAPGAAGELRRRLHAGETHGWSADDLTRRLDHFVAEDARAAAAAEAFARADDAAIGALAARSHDDARRLLQNQVAETDALVEQAIRCGAFAAKAFGAGFGGAVWALTAAALAETFRVKWLAAYRAQFPDRVGADAFLARPAPAASFL